MSESFLSSAWHLVAQLKPCLQPHAEVIRQRFRGQTAYIIRNPATGRSYRASPTVYLLLGLLEGRRTVAEAWAMAADQLDEAAPTQDETIRLLSQLHDADLTQSNIAPKISELRERRALATRNRWLQAISNPLSLRIPLWNPDCFLHRTLPIVRPFGGAVGMLLWLVTVLPSLFLAGEHWDELTYNFSDTLLATQNLFLIALVFPLVKSLHELGHAYAVKAGGGEVHEIGVMFLMLLPVPYVDASAATAFRSKWRRAGVGAAGMLVETFIAALAMQVWVMAEPGIVRSVAFNIMAIAGISTILFNGNPLLRFDGYFILCDLVESPNLAARANSFYGWLVEKYAFGKPVEAEPASPGERYLFAFYAPASLVYRVLITIKIALFVAQQFFFVGVAIAMWGIISSILTPVLRWSWRLVASPSLASVRARAIGATSLAVVLVGCFLGLVPLPLHTVAEGIVWIPEESIVRAGANGFIEKIVAAPGELVEAHAPLIRSVDPDLAAEIAVDKARVTAAQAQLSRYQPDDSVQATIEQRELDVERSALERAMTRYGELQVTSNTKGVFIVPRAEDLTGQFHKRGELLGYVVAPSARIARVVVSQDDVGLVREHLRSAEIRVASDISKVFPAKLVREVPAGSNTFPSEALTLAGGGSLAADRRDPNNPKALNRLFQFDVELPSDAIASDAMGAHVWVRFYHGTEPLAFQWWRRARQIFLSRFNA